MTTETEQQKGKLLIVDDGAANRKLLRRLLEKEGYSVSECESGQGCLDYCAEQLPDLVLLDVMMPGLNGFETVRELRTEYPAADLPVILVTAKTDGADVKEGIESGANDYITKPLDRSVLFARLKNQLTVLDNHRLVQEQQAVIEKSFQLQKVIGDSLDEGLVVSDAAGTIHYCNQLAEQVSCVAPKNLDELFATIYEGSFTDLLRRVHEQTLAQPQLTVEEELIARTDASHMINLFVYTLPVKFRAAEDLRLWVFRDRSEMRQLEAKMQQQVKMNTVSLFAVGVAHNFNNLMGSILGASEILERQTKGNRSAERCTNVIKRAVIQGRNLTKKMSSLVTTKVDSGDFEGVQFTTLLEALTEHYTRAQTKDITFHVSLPDKLPYPAISQENIREILGNLISNACDAIECSGDVAIAAEYVSDAEQLVFTVQDTGCGMSPEVQARLFEPFFSTKNLDTRNGMSMVGNGLSLWNVYTILKSVGGDIHIESTEGVGTTVATVLPVQK